MIIDKCSLLQHNWLLLEPLHYIPTTKFKFPHRVHFYFIYIFVENKTKSVVLFFFSQCERVTADNLRLQKIGDLNMKIDVKPHIRNDSVVSEMPSSSSWESGVPTHIAPLFASALWFSWESINALKLITLQKKNARQLSLTEG